MRHSYQHLNHNFYPLALKVKGGNVISTLGGNDYLGIKATFSPVAATVPIANSGMTDGLGWGYVMDAFGYETSEQVYIASAVEINGVEYSDTNITVAQDQLIWSFNRYRIGSDNVYLIGGI